MFGGIDPGMSGAMAILDADGNPFQVFDYPGDPVSLWRILNDQFIRSLDMKLVVLEQVHSMPKQGVSSSFKFGTNFGIWFMACAAKDWPTELITPQRWRKILDSSVPAHPTKKDLLNYARRRWPGVNLKREKDHGRAEALMIAEFSRLKFLGGIQ